MATDYDAPRKTDEELAEDSLEELKARRAEKTASAAGESARPRRFGGSSSVWSTSPNSLLMRVSLARPPSRASCGFFGASA